MTQVHYHLPTAAVIMLTVNTDGSHTMRIAPSIDSEEAPAVKQRKEDMRLVLTGVENIMASTERLEAALARLQARDQTSVAAFVELRNHANEVEQQVKSLSTQLDAAKASTDDPALQAKLDGMADQLDRIEESSSNIKDVITTGLTENKNVDNPPPPPAVDTGPGAGSTGGQDPGAAGGGPTPAPGGTAGPGPGG